MKETGKDENEALHLLAIACYTHVYTTPALSHLQLQLRTQYLAPTAPSRAALHLAPLERTTLELSRDLIGRRKT